MRVVAEVNKYVSDSEPWKLKGDDAARAARHGPARHGAGGQRLQHAALAVPAALLQRASTRCSAARATLQPMPRHRGGRGPRRRAPATRSSPATTPRARAGRAAPLVPGTPGRQAHAGLHQARPLGRRRGAGPARGRATAEGSRAEPAPAGGRRARPSGRRRRRSAPSTRDGIRDRRAAAREDGLAEPKEEVAAVRRRRRRRCPCRLLRPRADRGRPCRRPALPARRRVRAGRPRDPRRPEPPAGQPHRPGRPRRRLPPPARARFPAALDDSVAALDWLVAHGAEPRRRRAPRRRRRATVPAPTSRSVRALRRPGGSTARCWSTRSSTPRPPPRRTPRRSGGPRPRGRAVVLAALPRPRRRPGPRDPDLAPLLVDPAGRAAAARWCRSPVRTRWSTRAARSSARARDLGADVTDADYDGMVHGFWRHPEVFDAAEQALADTVAWLPR